MFIYQPILGSVEIFYYVISPWLIFNKACVGSGNQVKPSNVLAQAHTLKNSDGLG